MLVELTRPSSDGGVSLRIRGRGNIDTKGRVVAALLAAVESITDVPCDDYVAEIIGRGGSS